MESQDVFEKYALLYSAVFPSNMKLGSGKEVSKDFVIRLETAAETVCQAASAQIGSHKLEGYSDYLKNAAASMRANITKRRTEKRRSGDNPGPQVDPPRPGDSKGSIISPGSGAGPPSLPPKVDSITERRTPRISRPEERGEDFTKLPTKEIVHRLVVTKDIGEQRKGAKTIGDRAIRGTLDLDDAEKQMLEKYIAFQVLRTAAAQGKERQEAVAQLQRLWRLSVPQLLDGLGHAGSMMVQEAAVKNLCLMRDESVVKELISRVETSKNANFRQAGVFALGMMREKRDPMVPDRKVLDDAASKELAERLIIPFLNRIKATDTDPTMKKILTNAKKFLSSPFDARLRREGKSVGRTATQTGTMLSDKPPPASAGEDNAIGKPSEMPEASSGPYQYVSAWLGSAIVLAGVVWFGYRRMRKAT